MAARNFDAFADTSANKPSSCGVHVARTLSAAKLSNVSARTGQSEASRVASCCIDSMATAAWGRAANGIDARRARNTSKETEKAVL
jgi:hypothetical protein